MHGIGKSEDWNRSGIKFFKKNSKPYSRHPGTAVLREENLAVAHVRRTNMFYRSGCVKQRAYVGPHIGRSPRPGRRVRYGDNEALLYDDACAEGLATPQSPTEDEVQVLYSTLLYFDSVATRLVRNFSPEKCGGEGKDTEKKKIGKKRSSWRLHGRPVWRFFLPISIKKNLGSAHNEI